MLPLVFADLSGPKAKLKGKALQTLSFRAQEIRDACTDEICGEGPGVCRQRRMADIFEGQPHQAEPLIHASVVGQAAAEIASENQAPPRLAPPDRLALPGLHA